MSLSVTQFLVLCKTRLRDKFCPGDASLLLYHSRRTSCLYLLAPGKLFASAFSLHSLRTQLDYTFHGSNDAFLSFQLLELKKAKLFDTL